MIDLFKPRPSSLNGGSVDAGTATGTGAHRRSDAVDAARGFAIFMMIFYHLCYDLDHFNVMNIFMYTPFWNNYKIFGLSIFVSVSGMSMVLAARGGIRMKSFLKRFAVLVVCALAISIGSLFINPDRFIFFGAIHFFAVASLLGILFVRAYWLNLIIGSVVIFLGATYQHTVFDHPFLQWTGLMTFKPGSDDFFPFFPWFGVFLVGMFAGKSFMTREFLYATIRVPGIGALNLVGRHSLAVYIVHQPILMGLVWTVRFLFFS